MQLMGKWNTCEGVAAPKGATKVAQHYTIKTH